MQPKAFKRITVEFVHEVDGKLKPESLDFVQELGTGIAYQRDAFDSHIVEVLKEIGHTNPRVVSVYQRIKEPPMFQV
jgi:hypothetical protein